MSRIHAYAWCGRIASFGIFICLLGGAPALAQTTWWVDNNNPGCSDIGPGTAATPFCTIKPGGTHAIPGDTVMVKAGTYREQVTPPASGLQGSPIAYKAEGPGVLLLGTRDLSDAAGWSPTSTTAWSRAYAPPSAPRQVFLDGVRLALATDATTTTPNSFFYDSVAKVLCVDVGGSNPADGHSIEAGAQTYGFNVNTKSDLVIDGFEFSGQNSVGVRLFSSTGIVVTGTTSSYTGVNGILSDSSTGPVRIAGNATSFAASIGIKLLNSTGVTVEGNTSHDNGFHGISLQGSNGSEVLGNVSYANIKPLVRSAAGIDVNASAVGGSSDNVIKGNTAYGNQDSGIQCYNGSSRNLVVRNVSFGNGDHGFDTNASTTGTRYISNTSYGNYKDGFSVEGSSTDTTLEDNVSVDNGLTTAEFDLYVDKSSVTGFSSNRDILWNSASGTAVKFDGVLYATLADFRLSTGNEANGIGADPLFVDAPAWDLRIRASSPAVDSADAGVAGFEPADHDGNPPVDLTAVPDTGAGVPPYADRGAYEYVGDPDDRPVAALTLKKVSNTSVTANASGSTDKDLTPIATYTFDFGDGRVVGPQAASSASHVYAVKGKYLVTVTVRDTAGLASSASILFNPDDHAPTVSLVVTPTAGYVPLFVTADGSGSTDTDGTPIASYTFSFGDGVVVGPQATAVATHTYLTAGSFHLTLTVKDTNGYGKSVTKNVTVSPDQAPTPILTVTPTSGKKPLFVTADGSASTDPDPTHIATYTFNFGDGTVVGPQSASTATHTFVIAGKFHVTLTVTDTAGLSKSVTKDVSVSN